MDEKNNVWSSKESVEVVWNRLMESLKEEVTLIKQKGSDIIPQVQFLDILSNSVPQEIMEQIRKRGVAVIRNTVPKQLAEKWCKEAEEYVTKNNYFQNTVEQEDVQFWSTQNINVPKTATKPDTFIFQLYWSQAQIEARQHPNMSVARAFLNHFWSFKDEKGQYVFDPDKEITYADRLRIRSPGVTQGLRPHVDGGSVERWLDPDFKAFYSKIYEGKWEQYDPWDGVKRVNVNQYDSPNTCTVFRSYQGWLALSAQGAHRGTLQVVPLLKHAMASMLMRPLLSSDNFGEDIFCGAYPAKQHTLEPSWHGALLEALIPIPDVEAGDTVWWHPDLIHAVEGEHSGTNKSCVFYIPAAPLCEKNAAYLVKQKISFERGESPPDFPKQNREKSYTFMRASHDHFSKLGACQMGYDFWPEETEAERQTLLDKCKPLIGH